MLKDVTFSEFGQYVRKQMAWVMKSSNLTFDLILFVVGFIFFYISGILYVLIGDSISYMHLNTFFLDATVEITVID